MAYFYKRVLKRVTAKRNEPMAETSTMIWLPMGQHGPGIQVLCDPYFSRTVSIAIGKASEIKLYVMELIANRAKNAVTRVQNNIKKPRIIYNCEPPKAVARKQKIKNKRRKSN